MTAIGNRSARPSFRRSTPEIFAVISYYCIVNMPGLPVRDIAVVDAANDGSARQALEGVAHQWPGFETVYLYQGERLVTVHANPTLGFVDDPIFREVRAA